MTFTLKLTFMAMIGGTVLGTILAMMRLSSNKLISLVATTYVNIMRSIPLVMVIFWFYFLVPYIGAWLTGATEPIQVGAFSSCLITFVMFEAAYYCEIMRSGIQSIPRGQIWANMIPGVTDANDRAVPGRFAGLCVIDYRLRRCGIESSATRWSSGGNVFICRCCVFHHVFWLVQSGEKTAAESSDYSLRIIR
jgi:His/Glu/Gln/Arg/opine family amino acid ABC transporter permease subunit